MSQTERSNWISWKEWAPLCHTCDERVVDKPLDLSSSMVSRVCVAYSGCWSQTVSFFRSTLGSAAFFAGAKWSCKPKFWYIFYRRETPLDYSDEFRLPLSIRASFWKNDSSSYKDDRVIFFGKPWSTTKIDHYFRSEITLIKQLYIGQSK